VDRAAGDCSLMEISGDRPYKREESKKEEEVTAERILRAKKVTIAQPKGTFDNADQVRERGGISLSKGGGGRRTGKGFKRR